MLGGRVPYPYPSTLPYRKALQTASSDYLSSVLEENKHNPMYLFNTVAKLTKNKSSTGVDISQQHSSNDFMNISLVLSTLHWLPIKHCVDFKILLITYNALNGLASQDLSELLSHNSPPCPLRSQNSCHLIIPRISK